MEFEKWLEERDNNGIKDRNFSVTLCDYIKEECPDEDYKSLFEDLVDGLVMYMQESLPGGAGDDRKLLALYKIFDELELTTESTNAMLEQSRKRW